MAFSDWNMTLFRIINDLGKQYTSLNSVFVFLAEYMVYFLCFGCILYWFTRNNKNRMMVIQASIAFVMAEIVGKIVGMFYSNYQPFAELSNVNQLIEKSVNNSFPSDHTILFFSICFSFWLVRKKEGAFWLLLAFGVAISRIWVGVHYPADVMVGALLGIISALTVYRVAPKVSFIKKSLAIYEKGEQYFLPAKIRSEDVEQELILQNFKQRSRENN